MPLEVGFVSLQNAATTSHPYQSVRRTLYPRVPALDCAAGQRSGAEINPKTIQEGTDAIHYELQSRRYGRTTAERPVCARAAHELRGSQPDGGARRSRRHLYGVRLYALLRPGARRAVSGWLS